MKGIRSPYRYLRSAAMSAGIVTACAHLVAAAETNPQAHAKEIRVLVEEKIRPDGPGAAILVSRAGKPVYLGGFGLADLKTQRPITPDSLFDLASVSKQFTAAAILTLVEAGKLKLDAPVSSYVTDYAVPAKVRAVTIRDLLHHVSGLADYTSDDWDGTDEEFSQLIPETHLRWLNRMKARRAPGLKFDYNNSGYVLLALVVERISGHHFAQYLGRHVLEPAGMRSTAVLDGTAALPGEAAQGYLISKSGKIRPAPNSTRITGDGNIYTSVRELALWDAAVCHHTVIKAESQERAWENGRYDNGKSIKDDDGDGYGFGWVIEKERRIVSHSGHWAGSSTYLLLDLGNSLAVAILSNNGNLDTGDLAEEIVRLFNDE